MRSAEKTHRCTCEAAEKSKETGGGAKKRTDEEANAQNARRQEAPKERTDEKVEP